jgi:transposase
LHHCGTRANAAPPCHGIQAGEVDWTGRISKYGDGLVRTYLFEAAGLLMTRVAHWRRLKAWGLRLVKRIGRISN